MQRLFRGPTLNPLNVEYRQVGALIPYARNPRAHTQEQVARIAGLESQRLVIPEPAQ
ncbi:hypothetical protein JI739_19180 [Ramlibacter sp. AW1]|uniref:Uncharacterized protein n=1 Tax=Ramlibacter aurantiacus TaxID=2801330 RepID=A0A937D3A9_9BURK|nr:hypothetical protein [Ramlibacter aurantiacus]MBL0422479.1 hypothetical protein [Ramlibacter aurantiacus]